jgi:hypothetical protein
MRPDKLGMIGFVMLLFVAVILIIGACVLWGAQWR